MDQTKTFGQPDGVILYKYQISTKQFYKLFMLFTKASPSRLPEQRQAFQDFKEIALQTPLRIVGNKLSVIML